MKALGLHQPFAALIRMGVKTIETRFWGTAYRGPVLICSTKTEWPGGAGLLGGLGIDRSVLRDTGTMQCVVDVVDCRLGEVADEDAACCKLFDVNPRTGLLEQKHALVLANVRPVVGRPVSCGRKWFNVDDDLVELVNCADCNPQLFAESARPKSFLPLCDEHLSKVPLLTDAGMQAAVDQGRRDYEAFRAAEAQFLPSRGYFR